MSKPALLLCLIAALFVVGCGSNSDKSSGSSSGGGSSSSSSSGGSAKKATGKVVTVKLKNIAFSPANITVKKGTTVKWVNDDSVGHDVTKTGGPGPKFKSGSAGGLQDGDTFQQQFATPGTIDYVCTVHSNMKGKITVK